jgi:hypothetical protein
VHVITCLPSAYRIGDAPSVPALTKLIGAEVIQHSRTSIIS